jgi:hypothetical protein
VLASGAGEAGGERFEAGPPVLAQHDDLTVQHRGPVDVTTDAGQVGEPIGPRPSVPGSDPAPAGGVDRH